MLQFVDDESRGQAGGGGKRGWLRLLTAGLKWCGQKKEDWRSGLLGVILGG